VIFVFCEAYLSLLLTIYVVLRYFCGKYRFDIFIWFKLSK